MGVVISLLHRRHECIYCPITIIIIGSTFLCYPWDVCGLGAYACGMVGWDRWRLG